MQNDQQTNEEEQPIIEEKDWSKPDYTFVPKGLHLWVQRGYYLVCTSCDLGHATYIGKDRIMVGLEDGQAIIKTRKELGIA